jgi:hypothetical protein
MLKKITAIFSNSLNTPTFLTYIKYISIFNYGFDLLMINQWENISELKCEYDLELLCLQSGSAILKESKIDPVSYLLFTHTFMLMMIIFIFANFRIINYCACAY